MAVFSRFNVGRRSAVTQRMLVVLFGLLLFAPTTQAALKDGLEGGSSITSSKAARHVGKNERFRVAFSGGHHRYRRPRITIVKYRFKYVCRRKRHIHYASFYPGVPRGKVIKKIVRIIRIGRKKIKIITIVINRCPISH